MKCCLVFAGGGTKGPALAGALSAFAPKYGVLEVVGFGGCSVGSILAVLGAAGYRDQDELKSLLNEISLETILGDKYGRLNKLRTEIEILQGGWIGAKARSFRTIRKMFNGDLGLFNHQAIKKHIRELIIQKLPDLENQETISFQAFERATGVRLRIIATDLSSKSETNSCRNDKIAAPTSRIKIYGGDCTPEESVLDAVAASCSFPIVFNPLKTKSGSVLVDGGIISNAPSFLFRDLNEQGIRTYLIDLVNPPPDDDPAKDMFSYLNEIVTSFGASDELLREASPLYDYFPIIFDTPEQTFSLSTDTERLFNIGLNKITDLIRTSEDLNSFIGNDDELYNRLIDKYGAPEPYESLLFTYLLTLSDMFGIDNSDIRASIYVPSTNKVYPIYFGWNDPDIVFGPGFRRDEGPVGKAWIGSKIIHFEHRSVRSGYKEWKLSELSKQSVSNRMMTGIAIPVYPPDRAYRNNDNEITGQVGEAWAVILIEYASLDPILSPEQLV